MWLLGRLYPDHKSIAEFRRMHREAVTAAGAELIQFARSVGLIRGEWIAIDGSKFRAASSARRVLDREALQRYLDQMENADSEQETTIDGSAVTSALEKLRRHPEPEARFMRTPEGKVPAYNVQAAVDAEHALIITHQVSTAGNDSSRLQPMAESVREVLGNGTETINIIADTGYSNGEQAGICEASGLIPHIPAKRSINNHGDGTLLDRTAFRYQPETDSFLCPAGQSLQRKQLARKDRAVVYQGQPAICGVCAFKPACTLTSRRLVTRHLDEEVLNRMHQRATPQVMRLRRSTVEHPFANLKYRIFGHPRFLMRGLGGTHTEISFAVMAYNLKRMVNIFGGSLLTTRLRPA